jgi:hypothetical protein
MAERLAETRPDCPSALARDSLAANGQDVGPIGGAIETVLNATSTPFPRGVAFQTWLGAVGALGQNGVAPGQLSIYSPRYDATVSASSKGQAWITAPSGAMHLSFDTPVNATSDGGPPAYCGRAVFTELHVGSNAHDSTSPPSGCASGPLSPQETALEFALFDLLNCVTPDSAAP